MNENEIFDWASEISDDGEDREFVVLEPGEYDYEVTAFERGHHEHRDGGKAPSCPKATITIRIATDAGDCYIKENFLLYKKMEWKMSQFFRSIGLKSKGEAVTMALWDKATGRTGRATITKDKGREDNVYFNHVKTWLDPKEGADEWN